MHQPSKLGKGWSTLRHRTDFIKARRGFRYQCPSLVLQARRRTSDPYGEIRVGFTLSKQVGGACIRNRAKRRLREAARIVVGEYGRAGWDYVLVGIKGATASRKFQLLVKDLRDALQNVHKRSSKEIQDRF